jgi:hypothetical protein
MVTGLSPVTRVQLTRVSVARKWAAGQPDSHEGFSIRQGFLIRQGLTFAGVEMTGAISAGGSCETGGGW